MLYRQSLSNPIIFAHFFLLRATLPLSIKPRLKGWWFGIYSIFLHIKILLAFPLLLVLLCSWEVLLSLVMFLWWITLYHFLRLLLFFIGSYHFSTYKKLMIWCLFLLTSIEMFGIIHVAMCNRACRNKLKHGELSEWSKVQHSKSSSPNGSRNAENPLTMRVSGIPSFLKHPQF